MAQEAFVICDNLVKIYKIAELEVVALQGLDLVVGPGELLGIVGASGSGKSTLMNVLGGLDRPTAGRVMVGETSVPELKGRRLAQAGIPDLAAAMAGGPDGDEPAGRLSGYGDRKTRRIDLAVRRAGDDGARIPGPVPDQDPDHHAAAQDRCCRDIAQYRRGHS